jgi:hypothetical protein
MIRSVRSFEIVSALRWHALGSALRSSQARLDLLIARLPHPDHIGKAPGERLPTSRAEMQAIALKRGCDVVPGIHRIDKERAICQRNFACSHAVRGDPRRHRIAPGRKGSHDDDLGSASPMARDHISHCLGVTHRRRCLTPLEPTSNVGIICAIQQDRHIRTRSIAPVLRALGCRAAASAAIDDAWACEQALQPQGEGIAFVPAPACDETVPFDYNHGIGCDFYGQAAVVTQRFMQDRCAASCIPANPFGPEDDRSNRQDQGCKGDRPD